MSVARDPGLNGEIVPRAAAQDMTALYCLGALGFAVVVLTLSTPFAFRAGGDNAYMALTVPVGIAALAAASIVHRAPAVKALWLIVIVAIALRVILLFLDPLLSSDVYRYVWDGRVQAAGINPYRYFPAHEALTPLRDAVIYPNINRAGYAITAYPPVAQMFYFLVTRLGENVFTMKLALLACEAATAAVIVSLLRRMEKSPALLVAYAWHPLPLWEIANNGHVDALMSALMMIGLWLAFLGKPLRGAAAIALGALVKPFAALAWPAIWRPWDWKMPLVAVAVLALCYIPYLSAGAGVFGFVASGYLNEEEFTSGDKVFPLVLWRIIFGTIHGDVVFYFAGVALVLAAMSLAAARREPRSIESSLRDVGALLLAFLFLLSPNYPWYFLAVTPFLALAGGAPVWAAATGALLLQEEADWDFYIPWLTRKSVFYAVFLIACAYSFRQAWKIRPVKEGK